MSVATCSAELPQPTTLPISLPIHRCGLPSGHGSPLHEETDTEITWSDRSKLETSMTSPTSELPSTLQPGTWSCELHVDHGTARPIRGAVHHVWPLGAGGPNEAANRVEICSNGHDAVHAVMWAIVNDLPIPRCARAELGMAKRGVAAWEAAGKPGNVRAFMG